MTATTGPQTISACLDDLKQYSESQWKAVRESGQPMTRERMEEIGKQRVERAASHASRFAINMVAGGDLLALARLYTEAKQPEQAEAAIAARLADGRLTATERGEALLAKLDLALPNLGVDQQLRAEKIVAELDAIGQGATVQQIAGYGKLAGACAMAGLEQSVLKHRRSVLELYQKLNPDEQGSKQVRGALAEALRCMDTGTEPFIRQMKKLLQQAAGLFPNDPELAVEKTLQMFSLVGQPAPAIEAFYWLNGTPEGGTLALDGKAALLQFTAHWCGPCRGTYPAMLKLHERFQQRGLEIVLVTQLFGQETNLNEEQEVEADRKYFAEEHGLPFRIAIGKPDAQSDDRSRSAERNQQNYHVNAYPTFVVINPQGRITRVKLGGGPDVEAALAATIEPLLARDAASSRPGK